MGSPGLSLAGMTRTRGIVIKEDEGQSFGLEDDEDEDDNDEEGTEDSDDDEKDEDEDDTTDEEPRPMPKPRRTTPIPPKKTPPALGRREAAQELNRRIVAEVERRGFGPTLSQAEKSIVAKAVGVPGSSDAAKRQRVWSALRYTADVAPAASSRKKPARRAAEKPEPVDAPLDVALGVDVQDFESFLASTLRLTRAVKGNYDATEALGGLLKSLRFVTVHSMRAEL